MRPTCGSWPGSARVPGSPTWAAARGDAAGAVGAVGPAGRVQAVDADPAAVAAARALVAAAGLANVSVAEVRADHTGLEPGSVDVVMLRHVLAHNGAEDAIVGHLATLVRPGGCVYLVDADGTAMRVLPEHADLADLNERYVAFRAPGGTTTGRPAPGRPAGPGRPGAGRLPRPLPHRGAARGRPPAGVVGQGAMVTAGVATEEDVRRWERAFQELEAAPVPHLLRPLHRRRPPPGGGGSSGRRP